MIHCKKCKKPTEGVGRFILPFYLKLFLDLYNTRNTKQNMQTNIILVCVCVGGGGGLEFLCWIQGYQNSGHDYFIVDEIYLYLHQGIK